MGFSHCLRNIPPRHEAGALTPLATVANDANVRTISKAALSIYSDRGLSAA